MTIEGYLSIYVLGSSAAIVGALLFGLNRALAGASRSGQRHRAAVWMAAVVLVGWFAASIALVG